MPQSQTSISQAESFVMVGFYLCGLFFSCAGSWLSSFEFT